VYAHVFKPRQPLYNWLDPSYAARRLNFSDLANNILNRGVPILRLDANTFLGLEPRDDSSMATIFLSPLARVATTDIAMAARKMSGYTYQEFAGPLATLKEFAPEGADMSYDFFTRAQALYALIDGDALPLRLAHHFLLEAGIPSNTLVHDLQNHDEITFQMFELGSHGDFDFEGETLNGEDLKEDILDTMRSTVGSMSYNHLYRPGEDGVATTYAGFIAPALGIDDPYDASTEDIELIRRGHLLVAHANAMIPGIFSFSEWDAVGALPIPLDEIPENLTAGGDVRWVNRGGVDLMGTSSRTTAVIFELPEAQTLYGPLPEQLEAPDSFMSRLQAMLAAREEYGIKDATMNAVPPVEDTAVAVLVMTLPDSSLAITALNYGRAATSATVDLTQVPPGYSAEEFAGLVAVDAITGDDVGAVSDAGSLEFELEELQGRTIVVQRE
jgi:trehalose synthase